MFKIIISIITFITLSTLIWFISLMSCDGMTYFNVCFQISSKPKTLFTKRAAVWFLPLMNYFDMFLQTGLPCKARITSVALKWLLSFMIWWCMSNQMDLSCKSSITNVTYERFYSFINWMKWLNILVFRNLSSTKKYLFCFKGKIFVKV